MKKRDVYWLTKLFQGAVIVIIFVVISLVNIIQFNTSYMDEEQEEMQVLTRQIEWAVKPYLSVKDFQTVKKYAEDFKDEDITIRVFDEYKNLVATSKPDYYGKLSEKNSSILEKKYNKWKLYKHSLKDKKLVQVKKIEVNGYNYLLEVTISEADVIGAIVKGQVSLLVFFGICIFLLLWGLLETFYRTKITFNKFEDSVIKIANGELDTPIDVPDLELLEELSVSVKKMALRLKNQIYRLTQLEEYKSNFLQDITHEIKTPITAINSAIELIETDNTIKANNRECLDIIQFQVQSINKLVNDILYLSETEVAKTDEQNHFKELSLNSMVEKTIGNFLYLFENINFIQRAEININGNEELLERALSNLITNAIKYSGSDKIDVILDKNDSQIELSVRDYGTGIAQEHLQHIFERFYRVDKARSRQTGGTGLGLAIVKNIVELHRGQVRVESIPNKETIFTITIPAV